MESEMMGTNEKSYSNITWDAFEDNNMMEWAKTFELLQLEQQ